MTTSTAAAKETAPIYNTLLPGDVAPWFRQRSTSNESYVFDTAAGRYIVMGFYGSTSDEVGKAAMQSVIANRALFDDSKICFFGVSFDPSDEGRVQEMMPGIRHFWDWDAKIGRLYGALPRDVSRNASVAARRFWIVLDPMLRVRAVFPFKTEGAEQDELFAYLRALPPVDRFAGFEIQAPVLIIPNVFEPTFCQYLISLYEDNGGIESGFMREVGGKTVLMSNPDHKKRKDYTIEDQAIISQTQSRIRRRINPEIQKIHCFTPTRMERYIVSCYAAEDGGHFRPHRDNTTRGTAHRRYAVSINLNSEFEGGEVSFPEYGPRSYKAPPGGAVVFSCSLLHAVSKVTSGKRFAFLPFLYDEAAAKVREENSKYLADGGDYKA